MGCSCSLAKWFERSSAHMFKYQVIFGTFWDMWHAHHLACLASNSFKLWGHNMLFTWENTHSYWQLLTVTERYGKYAMRCKVSSSVAAGVIFVNKISTFVPFQPRLQRRKVNLQQGGDQKSTQSTLEHPGLQWCTWTTHKRVSRMVL